MTRISVILIIILSVASFFLLNADTIVNIDKSVASGVWTKLHSPYIVTGKGSIENLEIQSGVTVVWNASSVSFSKGYFRLAGTAQDSVVFNPGDSTNRITIHSLHNQAREFHAAFTRFSGTSFYIENVDSFEINLQNCLLDSCSFSNTIVHTIRFKQCSFLGTEMTLSNEEECAISGCVFKDNYGISFTGMSNIVIDSCFFTRTRDHALKFVYNTQITITNSIFDTCTGYQGAAIGLDNGNKRAVICNNVFSRNSATNLGGAIASFGTDTLLLIGNIFACNTASNIGGGAFLQDKRDVLINNLFTGNSSGLAITSYPVTLINSVFMKNGIAADSVQIYFGDSTVTKSSFYNCYVESGIVNCKYRKYRVSGSSDSITARFSGVDSAAITTVPLFDTGPIPNQFDYLVNLPVFPASGSSVINKGTINEYLISLCSTDMRGTQWNGDGTVDIGAIQRIDGTVRSIERHATQTTKRMVTGKSYDILGRSVDGKHLINHPFVKDNLRIFIR